MIRPKNLSFEELEEMGYKSTGIPGLIMDQIPIPSYGHLGVIDKMAGKAIKITNPKGLDYVGCAIFTYDSTSVERRVFDVTIPSEMSAAEVHKKRSAHYSIIIPLKKLERKL